MAWTDGSEPTGLQSTPAHANAELAVARRVAVRLESGATVTGTIVDDFTDLLHSAGEVNVRADEQRTVTARRWGIAADDGTLVFVDDAALETLPTDHRGPVAE